ncbi:hypothetical protein QFZ94_008557 [Paraburkholderia sp. JPY465]
MPQASVHSQPASRPFTDGRSYGIDQKCTRLDIKSEGYESWGFHTLRFWTLAEEPGRTPASHVMQNVDAACWPGMSRAQLLDRARRLALRASLRARPGSSSEPGPDGVRLYALALTSGAVKTELVAHVRRLARRCGARRPARPRIAAAGAGPETGRAFLSVAPLRAPG